MNRRRFSTIAILFSALTLFSIGSALSAEVSISRINNAKSGERKTVTIEADSIAKEISGFNLLVAHDQSLGMVLNVRAGDLHENFGWEYFTYRLISRDTVAAHMPGFNVTLINIIGLASLNGSTPIPINSDNVVLAKFDVLLAIILGSFSDETWTPFSFFWRDCNDNVLTSLNGDTVHTANQLFENRSSFAPRDPVSFAFPGFGKPDHPCSVPGGEEVTQRVDFVNSGIWSFVIDPVEECYNGDVNLNGIPYEMADLVLFIDYFSYGITVFPWPFEGSIAETDCNCDSLVLSVADVVCFVRTIIRDPGTLNKIPVSSGHGVQLAFEEHKHFNSLNLISDDEIALVYLRITPNESYESNAIDFSTTLTAASSGQIGDTTTIMLVDLDGQSVLSQGEHQLLEFSDNSELEIEAWVVDMSGAQTAFKLESRSLPDTPELLQNYPNPFNPSTTIEFNLPTHSEWQIEIYNVTGQLINSFNGASIGKVELEWDGTNLDGVDVASGVYFYKLITADQTTSRKMLLLK